MRSSPFDAAIWANSNQIPEEAPVIRVVYFILFIDLNYREKLFFCISATLRTIHYFRPIIIPLLPHRKWSITYRTDFRLTIMATIEYFHNYFLIFNRIYSISLWSLRRKNIRIECRLTIWIPKIIAQDKRIITHPAGIGVKSPTIQKRKRKSAKTTRTEKGSIITFWYHGCMRTL